MHHYRAVKRAGRAPMVIGMVTQRVRESYGEPYLLSQDEVAHRLAISRTTVWRLLKQKELEPVHIGSRTFITTRSINDFIVRRTGR